MVARTTSRARTIAVMVAIDALVAYGAVRFWTPMPAGVVSVVGAIILFEVVWLSARGRRAPFWALALLAALVLQVDWLPVARAGFAGLGLKAAAEKTWSKMAGETQPVGPEPVCGQGPQSKESVHAFLDKEYETAIGEIHKRLEYEQLLFGLKFTLIGGILFTLFGFMRKDVAAWTEEQSDASKRTGAPDPPLKSPSFDALGRSPVAAAFFWASVVVAATIDARIQFNAAFIATLGKWVKQLECQMLGTGNEQHGWEHFLSREGLLSTASYPFVRMSWGLVTWLLFAVTVFVFVVPRPQPGERDQLRARKLSRAFGLFAFGAFGLSSLGFRPDICDVVVHSLIWGTLGAVALAIDLPSRTSGSPESAAASADP